MRIRAVVAIVLGVLLVMPSTSASRSGARDRDDVAGRLDVARIRHGHGRGDKLWHMVTMHRRWGARHLEGNNEIRFHFSTDREDRYDEVHASVALKDGKLAAWVFPYVEGSDYANVGPSKRIRLKRPNRYSVKIFFDKGWVDARGRYAWSIGSSYRDRDSNRCRRSCFDYAPGRGPERVVHDL